MLVTRSITLFILGVYDGIASLKHLTLNYQYSDGLGQNAADSGGIHATVDFSCAGQVCGAGGPTIAQILDGHGNGHDLVIDPVNGVIPKVTNYKLGSGPLELSDVVEIKITKMEYELLSSTNTKLTNPDGFSNYNDQSNGFGDGNYKLLLGAIDSLYPTVNDIQYLYDTLLSKRMAQLLSQLDKIMIM